MTRLRIMALAAPLALVSACAQPDFNDRNQRAAAGVGAGAVLGGIVGSVTGSAGRGALIGGALGGVAGALSGQPEPDRAYPQGAPTPVHGYDPRQGGWYDQYGRWNQGQPPGYQGYQPNYR